MSRQTIRRVVMTGSVAAITATGAWYGAGLKTQKQATEAVEKHREVTAEEQLALLNERRGQLVGKKMTMERKLAELEARKHGATREESKFGRERR
ncbi:hypothetical protein V499_05058 [Pseudogymnoascus sp. VKM F-103]|uniref:Uncharacterized protein n=1 Tax=Pseudogymnoascus verrucosus TaxID=342668 RepID=A0A1B8GDS6_9PEZI|nr:uncharacterized protein VE01_08212 [Pseudogymnoascus verrucosus]KFY74931.1 hypothetical protein V499_05058 [Pseudogymnoascus sp. VKM F-103]OBT93977.1 hypothetical protein VE01_08212 [Pseudogymnoascus verrucosus]